jgi:hypothetical protein
LIEFVAADLLLFQLHPLMMSSVFLALVWLLGISFATVASNAEAFRGMLLLQNNNNNKDRNSNKRNIKDRNSNSQSNSNKWAPSTMMMMKMRGDSMSSSTASSDFWDDLVPPFPVLEEEDHYDDDYDSNRITHFCFLIHGHRGRYRIRNRNRIGIGKS